MNMLTKLFEKKASLYTITITGIILGEISDWGRSPGDWGITETVPPVLCKWVPECTRRAPLWTGLFLLELQVVFEMRSRGSSVVLKNIARSRIIPMFARRCGVFRDIVVYAKSLSKTLHSTLLPFGAVFEPLTVTIAGIVG